MNLVKQKVFKDPIHGYIYVPEDIVDRIVDNQYFQRLRRIEQTSMRCVYPSARHDRFAHSLGTYHLAKTAMNAVLADAAMKVGGSEEDAEKQRGLHSLAFNFEMGALLHDIGHSPMSHTLEKFFEKSNDLESLLNKSVGNTTFSGEFSKLWTSTNKPSPHEVVSAIIVCDCFEDDLRELCKKRKVSVDLEFIVRCIVGAVYNDNNTENIYYRNALIRLLNSKAIDMDKLDYVKRDSIISGYDNISVDTQRLLNSLVEIPLTGGASDSSMLAFGKSSVSVVQNVVDCRNMLYMWVYGHHKVVYESKYLIPFAIEKILDKAEANGGSRDDLLHKFFSIDAIKERLCGDDDIWVLLKSNRDIAEVAELLDRRMHRTALWKTKIEFDLLFPAEDSKAIGNFDVTQMMKEIESGGVKYKKFLKYIDDEYCGEEKSNVAVFIIPKTKENYIDANDVYVAINSEPYPFARLKAGVTDNRGDSRFSYVYIDKDALKESYAIELSNNKHEFTKNFVEYIKRYKSFSQKPDFN